MSGACNSTSAQNSPSVSGHGASQNIASRIDWLLAHGADPDVREGLEDNAMFALLSQGPVAATALQALLRRAVSPAGAGGFARFLAACVASDHAGRALEMLALDLLERGADPYAPTPAGDPPLALAVRLGWLRVVERLVACGVDLDARDPARVGERPATVARR